MVYYTLNFCRLHTTVIFLSIKVYSIYSSDDLPRIKLKTIVAQSLKTALKKLKDRMADEAADKGKKSIFSLYVFQFWFENQDRGCKNDIGVFLIRPTVVGEFIPVLIQSSLCVYYKIEIHSG